MIEQEAEYIAMREDACRLRAAVWKALEIVRENRSEMPPSVAVDLIDTLKAALKGAPDADTRTT